MTAASHTGLPQAVKHPVSESKGGVMSAGSFGPDRDVAAPRMVKMRSPNVVLSSFLGLVSLLRPEARLVVTSSISIYKNSKFVKK